MSEDIECPACEGCGEVETTDRNTLPCPLCMTREHEETITRLTAEVEWHKKNSDKWQDTQAAHLREVTRLTAEVAEYEAMFDAQWNADMAGVQMWREAHPGNDMVLPDRANFTSWILSEIMRLRSLTVVQESLIRKAEAENEKLAEALETAGRLFAASRDENARLTAEVERLRAYALKAFTVVEFCCGEGFLLSYPHYDCDDLIMEGVDLLKVESSEEARAALSGDKHE
jgi:hypothetical protein